MLNSLSSYIVEWVLNAPMINEINFFVGVCISRPPALCLIPALALTSSPGPQFVFTGPGPRLVFTLNLYLPSQPDA